MRYTAAINLSTLNVPPQRRYPDHPPLMVKDVLVVVKAKLAKAI